MDRAMVLTPAGVGAIAVVRAGGPGVGAFLDAHFSRAVNAGACAYGQLRDDGRVIDDAVVVLADDGEAADLNIHGGPWVVREVLTLLRRSGFKIRKWDPGELWAADGADLLDREVQAWLPLARTETALRALLAQGPAWRAAVARGISSEALRQTLTDPTLVHLLVPPRIAIVGLPNVGKSTLANQLFAQERSITADLPGTTRDWVGELANVDGLVVQLVDTPGLRETGDPIERVAIDRSRQVVESAELVLVVLDPTLPLAGPQQDLLGRFPNAVRVVNKSDAPARWDAENVRGIRAAARHGHGLDAVRRAIRQRFSADEVEIDRPRAWTGRQRQIIACALDQPDSIGAIISG